MKEEKKKGMTLGELIHSERFQHRLEQVVKRDFARFDNAVGNLGGRPKRHPMMRLREMGAEKVETMTKMYCDIINKKSDLPSVLRDLVMAICNPVLQEFIDEYRKMQESDTKEVINE